MSETDISVVGKPASIIPVNDKARLAALYRYEILDTAPEEFFDKITRFASKLTKAPSAFISLVDKDRVWFKANLSSLAAPCVDREDSLCSLTVINNNDITVFEDTHNFDSLMGSPYVSAPGGIRFYAGAPLITHDGYNIGTVCVIDAAPRGISNEEIEALKDLASLVVEHIEMRAAARKAIRKHDELYSNVVEHIAKPISEQQMLLHEAEKTPERTHIIKRASAIATQAQESIQIALENSVQESEKIALNTQLTAVSELARAVVAVYEPLAKAKQQELYFTVASRRELSVDPELMTEALKAILGTTVKYTHKGSAIGLDIYESDGYFMIEVSSEASALKKVDLQKVFLKYAKFSGRTTGAESASGLELARAKAIVEAHQAMIKAEPAERENGNKFTISFRIA